MNTYLKPELLDIDTSDRDTVIKWNYWETLLSVKRRRVYTNISCCDDYEAAVIILGGTSVKRKKTSSSLATFSQLKVNSRKKTLITAYRH